MGLGAGSICSSGAGDKTAATGLGGMRAVAVGCSDGFGIGRIGTGMAGLGASGVAGSWIWGRGGREPE